jgi:hypothetical protein
LEDEKMKKAGVFAAAILAAVLCISPNSLAYSGGDGSSGNPYQIANVADFEQLSASPGDWSLSFILTEDIDLTGPTFTHAVIAPDNDYVTAGFQGTPFTGIFDGNGHTICNMAIAVATSEYIGLFGYVSFPGQIMNLGVENVYIVSSNYVGGLAGLNDGSIDNCYSTGFVMGTSLIGGLVGSNNGNINKCYSSISVSGYNDVGGLVGDHAADCISYCYSIGTVAGSLYVGGLVGHNNTEFMINDCYSTSSVSGDSEVGGLVGYNNGGVGRCYAAGFVSGGSNTGGLIGLSNSGVHSSFWDIETSGQPTSAAGTGMTTAQMKTQSTFTDNLWDFGTIWNIMEGQTYPFLKRANYSGGSGTEADPYRIARTDDLLDLAATPADYNKYFILTEDIDLQGRVFTKAIIAPDMSPDNDFQGIPFAGVFDGDGHKITHFAINGGTNDYLGLFGNIDSGSVKNLGLEDCTVSGYSDYAGCLAGQINASLISNCYSTGMVSAAMFVGGLAGMNVNNSPLISCYATGSVSGVGYNQFVGGLVGMQVGTLIRCYATGSVDGRICAGGLAGSNCRPITSCYATGRVSGYQEVGGLVGENLNYPISDCYSTGAVIASSDAGGLIGYNFGGPVSNSFWDVETSGQSISAGGTGKTSAQMKTLSTFISAGWDFVDVWGIIGTQTYPYLKTQPSADLNYDGRVDLADFALFAAQWLEGI